MDSSQRAARFPRFAPGREVGLRGPVLLDLGALLAGRDDHRRGQHLVAAQAGQADPLHDGVGVFDAVADRTGHRVHDDLLRLDVHVGQQDVHLLADVDVDGALGDDAVAVGHGRAGDGAVVVLLHPVEQQVLAGAGLRDGLQHFVVLVEMVVAGDDQRHIHRGQHRLDEFDGLLRRAVALFRMRAFEAHADEVGAVFFDADLGHLRRAGSGDRRRYLAGQRDISR